MANEFKVRKGLIVQGSGSVGDNTILDVQGNQGQLFSVTDSLSGSLFSVGDISGIPILEVFSDEIVKIGTFGSEGLIINGSNVTSSGNISASGDVFGLNFGRDADNLFNFSTDNELKIRVHGGDRLLVNGSRLAPTTDSYLKLGSPTLRFQELNVNHITASNNISASSVVASDIYIDDNIYHNGNTGTRLNFEGDNQFRAIIAGSEKIHFNSARTRFSSNDILLNSVNISSSGDSTGSFARMSIGTATPSTNILRVDNESDNTQAIFSARRSATYEFKLKQYSQIDSKINGELSHEIYNTNTGASAPLLKLGHNNAGKAHITTYYTDNSLNLDGSHGVHILSNLTASGEISASGTIFTPKISFNNGDITLDNSSAHILVFDGGHFRFTTNAEARFGSSQILRISSDNTDGDIRSSGDLKLRTTSADGNIKLQSGSTDYVTLSSSLGRTVFHQDVDLEDNVSLRFNGDLRLRSTGGTQYLVSQGTSHLQIQQTADNKDIQFYNDDGTGGVTEYFRIDGDTENNKFFKPINLTGDLTASGNISASGNIIATKAHITTPATFTANSEADDLVVGNGIGSRGITIYSGDSSNSSLYFADDLDEEGAGDNPAGDRDAIIRYEHSNSRLAFRTAGNQQALYLKNHTATFNGKIEVDGTDTSTFAGDVTVAGTLTAQEFHTEFVSSSIIFESGSTKFGDTLDDVHNMTGSLNVTGSTTIHGGILTVKSPDETVARFERTAGSGFTAIDIKDGVGTTGNSAIRFSDTGASKGEINYEHADDSLRITTNASEQLRITSAGNTGIGTANPPEKLTVEGNISASGNLLLDGNITASNSQFGSGGKIEITHSGGAGVIDNKTANLIIKTSANERISLSPAGAESLTVAHGGNVGIGTNSPSEKLTVEGNISSSGAISSSGLHVKNTGAAILTLHGDINNSGDSGEVDGIIDFLHDNPSNPHGFRINSENHGGKTALHFQEQVTGTFKNRLILHQDGGVGIGEGMDNPGTYAFAVSGSKMIIQDAGDVELILNADTDNSNENHDTNLTFKQDSTHNMLHIGSNGTAASPQYNGLLDNSAFIIGGNGHSGVIKLQFGVNHTASMALTTTGLGIGTTSPDASLNIKGSGNDSSTTSLKVIDSDNASLFYVRNDGVVLVGHNYFYVNHSNGMYSDGKIRARAGITDDQGPLLLGNNDAVDAMTISSSKVGIGITTPQSALHIHTGDGGTYSPNSSHDDLTIEGSGNIGLQLFSPNSSYQYIAFGDPESTNRGYIRYHHGDDKMVLRTAGGDRVHIDSSGKVGIGNNNPSEVLTVEGNISASGTGSFGHGFFDGKVGIGTTTPTRPLHVVGGAIIADTTLIDNPVGSNATLEVYDKGGDAKLVIHHDDGGADKIAELRFRNGGNDTYLKVPSNTNGLVIDTENKTNAFVLDTTGRITSHITASGNISSSGLISTNTLNIASTADGGATIGNDQILHEGITATANNLTVGTAAEATNATNATNVTTAADSGNAEHFITFTDSAAATQQLKTDAGAKYNPSTNTMTVGRVAGTDIDAGSVTVSDSFDLRAGNGGIGTSGGLTSVGITNSSTYTGGGRLTLSGGAGSYIEATGYLSSSVSVNAPTGSFEVLVGDTSQATSLEVDGPITGSIIKSTNDSGFVGTPLIVHQFMAYLPSFTDGNFYYGHNTYGPYHHVWTNNLSSEPTDMSAFGAARHAHFMHIVPVNMKNISLKGTVQASNTAADTVSVKIYKTTRSNSVTSTNSTLTLLGTATSDNIDNVNHCFNMDMSSTSTINAGEALVLLLIPTGTSCAIRANWTLYGYTNGI